MNNSAGAKLTRLPESMRGLNQWCIAAPDKSPYVLGANGLVRASVDHGPWMDFATACQVAAGYGVSVGFVLTQNDPFSIVDLDIKDAESRDKNGDVIPREKWTTEDELRYYEQMLSGFETYAELSRSGKGLHLIVEGDIGAGARAAGIEVYSHGRYMICTGNAVSDLHYRIVNGVVCADVIEAQVLPVVNRQNFLDALVRNIRQIQGDKEQSAELVELEEVDPDEVVYERARSAHNGAKFVELWNGDWAGKWPSQSEADLALMGMLAFYSKSNAQCRRLFRYSALGKRDKAVRNDVYLNRTLARTRAKEAKQAQVNMTALIQAAEVRTQLLGNGAAPKMPPVMAAPELPPQYATAPSAAPEPPRCEGPAVSPAAPLPPSVLPHRVDLSEYMARHGEDVKTDVVNDGRDDALPWPPGVMGEIAKFVYRSAPRPVREVAIVAALGFMAGVAGRAFCIPQSGLNLYITLVARSAVGKEAMHSGIGLLVNRLRESFPAIDKFINFNDFASGPALVKACAENTSFVSIAGEWGRKLKRMALEDGRETGMSQLRTVMTNLYQKSGPSSIVGGLTYSSKENNVGSVNGVAYSMIGETTPGTLYQSLTTSMMEDGFLSRFTFIEYHGDRPQANRSPLQRPPEELVRHLLGLCQHAVRLNTTKPLPVRADDDAAALLRHFDEECDRQINSTDNESWRQMWNRAYLKVARMAALLAVADNDLQPYIALEHVEWAMHVVRKDITRMTQHMQEGNIGTDDTQREKRIVAIMTQIIVNGAKGSYQMPEGMAEAGIVPRRVIQLRTSSHHAFTGHRGGGAQALDLALRGLMDSGYIIEVDRAKLATEWKYFGKCYQLLSAKYLDD